VRDVKITGGDLVDAIVEMSGHLGWLRCHFRPARTNRGYRTALQGDAGFPDLVLVREDDRRLIFAEVKGDGDRIRPEQQRWLDALGDVARSLVPTEETREGFGEWSAAQTAELDVRLWTADDWRSGGIEADLRGIAPCGNLTAPVVERLPT
jgi:hypothetical protein